MLYIPELEQLAGTQTRGLANPLSMRTMEPMRPMVAARPRSSLSYTLALLKLWVSRPMMAGMLMMSSIAMVMSFGVFDEVDGRVIRGECVLF